MSREIFLHQFQSKSAQQKAICVEKKDLSRRRQQVGMFWKTSQSHPSSASALAFFPFLVRHSGRPTKYPIFPSHNLMGPSCHPSQKSIVINIRSTWRNTVLSLIVRISQPDEVDAPTDASDSHPKLQSSLVRKKAIRIEGFYSSRSQFTGTIMNGFTHDGNDDVNK
ncbi:hypothetical protein BO78DRAFT_63568 [Aspergillus sclerotiicarbonarius CBS 121057]|uniref:Uncharacterized protein n=1 Tax=Aspergillus sclerotiicarbonarius (strain CBS 121057 / IBT 28362) TaxID=1448318 RepID=A0A319ERN5_ASPSB|nr:hypothetical protein BO78DRAFT_63568 [Aspergillus sclerotiicarbonarius CBS 121057]